MRKLILLMGILLFFTQGAFAQKKAKNIDIKWTSEKKCKKIYFTQDAVFAYDDTGYYILRKAGAIKEKNYLVHIDNKLNLDKSR